MERRAMAALFFGGLVSMVLNGFTNTKKESSRLLRPPGAQDETIFLATCTRCGKCAQICPQKAIRIGHSEQGLAIGTPYIVPRQSACDLCFDCITACPSGALRAVEKEKVRMGTAEFNKDNCLAWQGEECKVCYTSCPFYNQAIKLEDHKRPVVNPNVCVGCGICEYVCVTNPPSVTIKARG